MILLGAFIFLLALIYAFLEIEMEGKFGWAEKIPTWYSKKGIAKFISKLNNEKPVTGYHLYMTLFIFGIFHLLFFITTTWTLVLELQVISYYLLFSIFEDFLWFVFNPYYGLKNFRKDRIWWHSDVYWIFGKVPLLYVFAILLSAVFAILSSIILAGYSNFYDFLVSLVIAVLLTMISTLFVPAYKKWYFKMRKEDGRKKAVIFHK